MRNNNQNNSCFLLTNCNNLQFYKRIVEVNVLKTSILIQRTKTPGILVKSTSKALLYSDFN